MWPIKPVWAPLQGALRVAYRSGTIAGMIADGLGLLGGTVIFLLYGEHAPEVLLGFGFGGTLLAMFMRVGGGIYTKAADVGADLVGKVEAGIPEDDPRNAAAIADLVGDNVGDFSGMAEDVFESYEVTIVSAMILGLAVMQVDPTQSLKWIVFPLLVQGHRRIFQHYRNLRRFFMAHQRRCFPGHGPFLRPVVHHFNRIFLLPGGLLCPGYAAFCSHSVGHPAGSWV